MSNPPNTPHTPTAKRPAKRRAPARVSAPMDTPNPPVAPAPEPETPTATAARRSAKPRAGTLESRLAETLSAAAILPAFAGDQYSAFILSSRSEKFAHDLAELAKVNPRIKRILEGLLDGKSYGGVMFSGAAMLLPILWSYGVLPSPPVDPFAAFYPQIPDSVVPRSATVRKSGRSTASRAAGKPGAGGAVTPPVSGAPGNGDTPPGVVTVAKGAHPPINPAAL